MYNIKMKKVTLDNLKLFLDRVTLTGKEVPAYVEILQALLTAEKEGD